MLYPLLGPKVTVNHEAVCVDLISSKWLKSDAMLVNFRRRSPISVVIFAMAS